jgi:hypothetical protein
MMARQDTKEQDRLGTIVLRQGILRNLEARRRMPGANAKFGLSHMTYYLWPPSPRERARQCGSSGFQPFFRPAVCGCDDVQRLRRESMENAFSVFLSPSMHCA